MNFDAGFLFPSLSSMGPFCFHGFELGSLNFVPNPSLYCLFDSDDLDWITKA